ncbi:MAG: lipopolysaccharide transport periplasmic protein LptA [Bilophila sp.]
MKKHHLCLTLLALLCASLFSPVSTVWAAPKTTPPKPDKNLETRITSDQLTYLAEKQRIVFEKNVHVQRPDFKLWADRLTVYLKPPKEGQAQKNASKGGLPEGMAAGDVDRIVAEHQVRMESEGRIGTSDKATYTLDDGVVLMEGNPRLTDGDNTVTGETIRYFTEENRSEVKGSTKKRVEAVFSGSKVSPQPGKGVR